MYGGRAKRIDLAKKAIIFIVCIIVILVSIKYAQREEIIYDSNAKFDYLKNYFISRNYKCEMIENSGNKCYLYEDGVDYTFFRFTDGFTYYVSADSYSLSIIHLESSDTKNGIVIKTNSNALVNYQNKVYTCTNKDSSILSDIDTCTDEEGMVINGTYKGVVEKAILELNNALNSSGYDVNTLINEYTWVRNDL